MLHPTQKLFELHLPNRERVFADLNILAAESKGLSGRDILNVCLNAIYAGSTADDAGESGCRRSHARARDGLEEGQPRRVRHSRAGRCSAKPSSF